jgi:hypothetical protein
MVLWELHLRRTVIHYLVSLREAGHNLREAVYSLQRGVPEGAYEIEPGSYRWNVEGHKVTFEVVGSKRRIHVLTVEAILSTPAPEPQ